MEPQYPPEQPPKEEIQPQEAQSQEVQKPAQNQQKKQIKIMMIVIITLLLILVIGIIYGAWYINEDAKEKERTNIMMSTKEDLVAAPSVTPIPTPTATPIPMINKKEIPNGAINWQRPEELKDLGLTTEALYNGKLDNKLMEEDAGSHGIRYYKTGTIATGEYKDAEVLTIFSTIYEGMGWIQPVIFNAIKEGEKITILNQTIREENYSGAPEVSLEERYAVKTVKKYFSEKPSTVFDSEITIKELEYPETIKESEREIYKKDASRQLFFDDSKLKVAFLNADHGNIYMLDETKRTGEKSVFSLNRTVEDGTVSYVDYFEDEGLYIKAPDGSTRVYRLDIDIFANDNAFSLLQATWNNNKKNKVEYEQFPAGCGSKAFLYNKTKEVNLATDTIVVGKTEKGDDLYGYKTVNAEEVQKLYKENYYVEKGEKDTIEGYLSMNPVVFWKDQLGRIAAFYRADLMSPAECGKPVIYLYPEQPTEISVSVHPTAGITVSEPEHGPKGWKVVADTQSNILNKADGVTYPYLFWEGASNLPYTQSTQGFVVKENELGTFFDDSLAKLGMNRKETADFKEFWIPEMKKQNKPWYFVTYLPKRFTDQVAPLVIEPKPDTVIRVMMDYKGLDEYKEVTPLHLTAPARKGFTAVEWGGMLK